MRVTFSAILNIQLAIFKVCVALLAAELGPILGFLIRHPFFVAVLATDLIFLSFFLYCVVRATIGTLE